MHLNTGMIFSKILFYFLFISGYNDARDLSLGDITDRMKKHGEKELGLAQYEVCKDLDLVWFLIKLDEQHMMPCVILISSA